MQLTTTEQAVLRKLIWDCAKKTDRIQIETERIQLEEENTQQELVAVDPNQLELPFVEGLPEPEPVKFVRPPIPDDSFIRDARSILNCVMDNGYTPEMLVNIIQNHYLWTEKNYAEELTAKTLRQLAKNQPYNWSNVTKKWNPVVSKVKGPIIVAALRRFCPDWTPPSEEEQSCNAAE